MITQISRASAIDEKNREAYDDRMLFTNYLLVENRHTSIDIFNYLAHCSKDPITSDDATTGVILEIEQLHLKDIFSGMVKLVVTFVWPTRAE